MKSKIIEMLVKNQEQVKQGSDGDYSTEHAVMSYDYELIADGFLKILTTELDEILSDVPNKEDCKTIIEAYLIEKITKLKNNLTK